MTKEHLKQHGPSWADVWNWCADLEKQWHCYANVQVWRVRKEGFYSRWDVRVECKWLGVGGKVTREEAVSGVFPNNDQKTLPGLLLKLLFDIDKKLSEIEHEEKNGALRQIRFG